MATPFTLNNTSPTTALGGGQTALATGAAAAWTARAALTTGATSALTVTANTAAGPVNGIEPTISSAYLYFLTEPVASAVTISGTVTLAAYASESDMKANVTFGYYIDKVSAVDFSLTRILTTNYGTELGTSLSYISWTASPTSTALAKGDRIRIVPFFIDAGTMASGYTASFRYGNASDGISTVQFNETFSVLTFSASQYIYPTNTASDVATSDVDYKIWTSRGT